MNKMKTLIASALIMFSAFAVAFSSDEIHWMGYNLGMVYYYDDSCQAMTPAGSDAWVEVNTYLASELGVDHPTDNETFKLGAFSAWNDIAEVGATCSNVKEYLKSIEIYYHYFR